MEKMAEDRFLGTKAAIDSWIAKPHHRGREIDEHLLALRRQTGSRSPASINPMAVSKAGTGSLRSIRKTAFPVNNTAFGRPLGAKRNLRCSVLLESFCKPKRATIVDPVAG